MRPIGFSTGALAHADFRRGLSMVQSARCEVVELSALRQPELFPMLEALDTLDLSKFSYVSLHAPSRFESGYEAVARDRLKKELYRNWPIVVHPDAVQNITVWREFGPLLCIENMDKRKQTGRTAAELAQIFDQVPDASLCFDIGHARQCDPTMTESYSILREFGSRLQQVHVSEVNTRSKHDPLSYASILAFQEVAHLIPTEVPLILETPTVNQKMSEEIAKVRDALPISQTVMA